MPEQDIFQKYPFLKDAPLSEDLKRLLIEKSIQSEEQYLLILWDSQNFTANCISEARLKCRLGRR